MAGKYTSPAGGRQPFGGLTVAGRKRLLELIDMVEKNRKDNAEFIKSVEDRVRQIVYDRNGRAELDSKKLSRGNKKNTQMASAVEVSDDVDCDMEDMSSWQIPSGGRSDSCGARFGTNRKVSLALLVVTHSA